MTFNLKNGTFGCLFCLNRDIVLRVPNKEVSSSRRPHTFDARSRLARATRFVG